MAKASCSNLSSSAHVLAVNDEGMKRLSLVELNRAALDVHSLPIMSYKEFVDEQHEHLAAKKFAVHRWLYGLVAVLTMVPVVLLTVGQVASLADASEEFALCLLLLVHSGLPQFRGDCARAAVSPC